MDQVLLAMSEKLGKFLPLIGGPEHSHVLIPIFEALCEAEEITVRDMAVSSICKILKQLGPTHKNAAQTYFELFKRTSNEEAGELFYARVSCCHIVPDLYRLLNDSDRISLKDMYNRLCKDELPIVRRAAATQFVALAEYLDPDVLSGEYMGLLHLLVSDESQTVQVIAIEHLSAYATLLKKHNQVNALTTEILPLVKNYSDSPSWKLRQALSKNFGVFSSVFLPAEVSSDIFSCLINLIQDPEPEARSLAILEVLPFLEVVGTAQFIGELAPVAVQLIHDPMLNMRKLLADLCVDVAAKVGPEAVAMHLSDLVMKLMEDEDPLVRLRIVKKLPLIAEEAPSLCTRLTECLKALFTSPNWRVRKELLISMPSIVKHMGQDYYIDHFLGPTLLLLKDGVDEVRTACAAAVPLITLVSNSAWSYEAMYPAIRQMSSTDYLGRLSMISALEGLMKIESLSDKYHGEILSLLLHTAVDRVPNIRIRAAQALNSIMLVSHVNSNATYRSQVMNVLADLQKDKDKDVKYFASKSAHE